MFDHLKNHVKAINDALARCPQCGGEIRITPEPYESRFAARCCNPECNHTFFHPVRASALSVPGLIQILGTITCSAGAYVGTHGSIVATIAVLLIGGVVIRFVLRLTAFIIVQSSASLGWKDEMIAYLAPPPFLKRECRSDTQQNSGADPRTSGGTP